MKQTAKKRDSITLWPPQSLFQSKTTKLETVLWLLSRQTFSENRRPTSQEEILYQKMSFGAFDPRFVGLPLPSLENATVSHFCSPKAYFQANCEKARQYHTLASPKLISKQNEKTLNFAVLLSRRSRASHRHFKLKMTTVSHFCSPKAYFQANGEKARQYHTLASPKLISKQND